VTAGQQQFVVIPTFNSNTEDEKESRTPRSKGAADAQPSRDGADAASCARRSIEALSKESAVDPKSRRAVSMANGDLCQTRCAGRALGEIKASDALWRSIQWERRQK
jgi:hypothetical protein